MAPERDQTRVNERIRIAEIRLIGPDGEQLGAMTPEEGMAHAREHGLDLVEVAPNSRPPVCRIMDYGRYKYEQKKKKSGANKKAHAASLKEVKLRPGTDIIRRHGDLHDFTHWQGPILTDSGGFQVFCLAKMRKISEDGVTFASPVDGAPDPEG